jgi:hypothetical protein
MPVPLVSFVPIFVKTSSIAKCYIVFQIVMASSFSYTHFAFGTKCGEKRLLLEKTYYIMNSLSFWDPNAYIFVHMLGLGFRVLGE